MTHVSRPPCAAVAVGGAEPKQQESLKLFAKHLGIAFQIRDDILGAAGDLRLVGKPVGSDLANLRPSMVSIALASILNIPFKELRTVVAKDPSCLRKTKEFKLALAAAEKMCRQHGLAATRAVRSLRPLPPNKQLESLVRFAVSRKDVTAPVLTDPSSPTNPAMDGLIIPSQQFPF